MKTILLNAKFGPALGSIQKKCPQNVFTEINILINKEVSGSFENARNWKKPCIFWTSRYWSAVFGINFFTKIYLVTCPLVFSRFSWNRYFLSKCLRPLCIAFVSKIELYDSSPITYHFNTPYCKIYSKRLFTDRVY